VSGSGSPHARAHLSIGEVLSLLQDEFPDVTISKIRFLESQGLLDPERTPSGYRKFYDYDIERLRWILRLQKDHYLPLKVIKDRLDEAGGMLPFTDGSELAEVERQPTVLTNGMAPGPQELPEKAAPASSSTPPPPNAPSTPPSNAPSTASGQSLRAVGNEPATRNGRVAVSDRDRERAGRPAAGGPPASASGSAAPGATSSQAPSRPAGGGPGAQAPRPGGGARPGGPGQPTSGTRAPQDRRPAPSREPGRGGSTANGRSPSGPPPGGRGPGPGAGGSGGGGQGPPQRARQGGPPGQGGRGAAPRQGQSGPGPGQRPAPRRNPPGPAPSRSRVPDGPSANGHVTGFEPGPDAVSLSLDELAEASGLTPRDVRDLERFGLIEARHGDAGGGYDGDALVIARTAAGFLQHGIEARHMRTYKVAVDREAGLFEQIVTPVLKQRNPEARVRAQRTVTELIRLGEVMRGVLLRRELRDHLGGG
jgi:DNA-binding transcriptional MerR regulator